MTPDDSHSVYSQDVEFRKLLARRGDIDVIDAALELARDSNPQLVFTSTRRWIEDRVDELAGRVSRLRSEEVALQQIAECLAGRHGLGGDADCYRQADSSFLHRVIETTRGIPISLSLLYMAVGERLGLDVFGVASPAHFLLGCQTSSETLFLDAFSHGRVLRRSRAIRWLSRLTGWSHRQIAGTFQPASARQIIIRMLNNLKRVYAHGEDWSSAWNVQQRLAALHPAAYEPQRDLAVIALKSNRAATAYDLLQSCLQRCPDAERDQLEALRRQACAQIAGWN